MSKTITFPFAAVVGQEDVKQALLMALINPKTGGVLVTGEKGSAKSSLVRALAYVMPDKKIINLPLNATEDMVFGNIDIEYAVTRGKKVFSPGMLARAHEQVLYVDEVNLLRREVLNGILDTADRGVNILEREGLSHRHEARFTFIGTMNPEEGVLSSTVLDRFGLFVTVSREKDPAVRTEILRRVLAYEKDPALFCQQYEAGTRELTKHLQDARGILGTIEVSIAMMELAAQYCAKAHSAGHRAELFLIEAAKAVAALAGRGYLLPGDLERAAFFVLPHRMRQEESPPPAAKEQQEELLQDRTDQEHQKEQPSPPPSGDAPLPELQDESEPDQGEDLSQDAAPQQNTAGDQEQIADIDKIFSTMQLLVSVSQDRQIRQGSGKRSLTRTNLKQGRYVRSCLPKGKLTDLAFDATLRAAAPYQRLRRRDHCCIAIQQEDLRQKVREKRIGNTFLFVVDASGSMGARERMRAVKGAIFSMLQDAYQKRDQVGLVAFRRDTAEVVLPVTRSVDLAQKCLQQLPTGGKTPLAQGLATAFSVLQSLQKKEREMQPVLVLITDGRANRSKADGADPVAEAVKMAEKIKMAGLYSVVIDTETDFIKLGVARTVAQEMGASYYSLQELSEQKILHIVKNLQ